jgi:hypothetical protein
MKAPLHLALLALGCLGLGALGGFGLVYTIYQAECHDRLAAQAAECRRTTLNNEGDRLTGRAHETRDAQEQQAAQAQLAHARAALQTSQKVAAMAQRDAQDARAAAAVVHKEGQERARRADQAVQAQQQQCQIHTAEREACAAQLAVCTSGLTAQATEVAHAHQSADEAHAQHAALAQDWSVWQASWQARARAQTVLRYGAGPLQVEITLDLGDAGGLQSLVLQLDRLDALPLTTATFVYLVASGLYTGTPLQPSGNVHVLRGGQLTHAAARVRANLTQRWAAHGLEPAGGHLWAAEEASTIAAPCPRYGIGVDWEHTGAGDFFILLELPSAASASSSSRPCLGRVVHGMEWLPAVTTATIAATRILVVDAAAARDEL